MEEKENTEVEEHDREAEGHGDISVVDKRQRGRWSQRRTQWKGGEPLMQK